MKIILCGPILTESEEKMLLGTSPAACRFMNNMDSAFKKNGVSTIGMVYLTNKVINEGIFANSDNSGRYLFFKTRDKVSKFQDSIMNQLSSGDIVILYNMIYAYFGLYKRIKKAGGIPVLLLADYTDVREEKGLLRKIYAQLCAIEFKKYKHIVSLARMPENLFSKETKHLDICGGINFDSFKEIKTPNRGHINIMYAGLLNEVTGVDMLIQAIKQINNENVSFWFSGKGELEWKIQEAENKDSRIKYLGFLSSDEYYKRLNDVNIFVNPRNMSLRQNANNFPSKVLEYLATGRVIVSTKFSGNELFAGSILWCESNVDSIARVLNYAIQQYDSIYSETYIKNLELARSYDWIEQANKIVRFAK